ncbi:hypothetical protein DERP_004426 [Dermatophagoides pteronyssinus]|uniref:Transmembrane protein n=1 Tax=Dermatophagoides pteronyssinus TaxID=6956 RepID=A0ABQ8JNW8_DERPT|nr:hypothetical protein DERP_004426 [Dermatophagoides pteronyssinus]
MPLKMFYESKSSSIIDDSDSEAFFDYDDCVDDDNEDCLFVYVLVDDIWLIQLLMVAGISMIPVVYNNFELNFNFS